jgi:hypothetical protein
MSILVIRNQDEAWDVSADELSALNLRPGDSIGADELAEALSQAAIPGDLRAWLNSMIAETPEQTVYVEARRE